MKSFVPEKVQLIILRSLLLGLSEDGSPSYQYRRPPEILAKFDVTSRPMVASALQRLTELRKPPQNAFKSAFQDYTQPSPFGSLSLDWDIEVQAQVDYGKCTTAVAPEAFESLLPPL